MEPWHIHEITARIMANLFQDGPTLALLGGPDGAMLGMLPPGSAREGALEISQPIDRQRLYSSDQSLSRIAFAVL